MLPNHSEVSALLTFHGARRAHGSDTVIRGRSNCSDFQTSSAVCAFRIYSDFSIKAGARSVFETTLIKNALSGKKCAVKVV